MSVRRKIIVVAALVIFAVAVYFGYEVFYTVDHMPEAYAAWDTGTLLVEYMKSHDSHWPSSWDDLLSVVRNDTDHKITLYGASVGDTKYALSLQKKVAINWQFEPSVKDQSTPVTRLDGTKFPIVWEGAEPNEMVHAYLSSRAKTP